MLSARNEAVMSTISSIQEVPFGLHWEDRKASLRPRYDTLKLVKQKQPKRSPAPLEVSAIVTHGGEGPS